MRGKESHLMTKLHETTSQPDHDSLGSSVTLNWKLLVEIEGDMHRAGMYRPAYIIANHKRA
jgi:hypothetical protein